MAEHRDVEYATAEGNDYPAHERTYELFLSLLKWHIIVIAFVLMVMAYYLT
jgi:hypothetical protein